MTKYFIAYNRPELLSQATDIASFTKVIEPIIDNGQLQVNLPNTPYLYLDETGLSLKYQHFDRLYISDIYNKLSYRYRNLEQELLIQALKIKNKPKHEVLILDLTAGLAKDASLIAEYGYNVIMIEQNPILATMIYYAQLRKHIPNTTKIVFMNSLSYLNQLDQNTKIDAIYLDPMFKQSKSAKPKKSMQIIQTIMHNNEHNITNEDTELFKLANQISHKVVVKREDKQSHLIHIPKPSYSKNGKTVRYDVYINGFII